MRWLVTGGQGMLAVDLIAVLRERGHDVQALSRQELDITNPAQVGDRAQATDVVTNCAAWTNVNEAESREAEAFAVNAVGAQILAAQCQKIGAQLVHFSTDYVFGKEMENWRSISKTTPKIGALESLQLSERENQQTETRGAKSEAHSGTRESRLSAKHPRPIPADACLSPLGAYGRTKAAGEWAVRAYLPERHLILRTAWLYGAHGECFPKRIAKLLVEHGRAKVVNDQIGQPTWTRDVAELAVTLVEAGAPSGTYHATSSGQASWFEFAQAIAAFLGHPKTAIQPTDSASFPSPAPRPSWSVLDHSQLAQIGVNPIGNWMERWQQAAPTALAD